MSVEDVLKDVVKRVNLKHKLEVAVYGESPSRADVKQWISTASPLLNLLMGRVEIDPSHYGVATGRIYELFGDYSHGKSTIAQIIMNAFQAVGGVSVLLDSESGWNRVRAVTMGHNSSRHLVVEVDTCESGFNVIDSTVEQFKLSLGGKVPVIFVWDTIAASPTEGEFKGDQYESGMMFKPKLIRRELKKLTQKLDSVQASVIFVNQTIEGPKPNRTGIKTTPGGGGIKFWSSQRLQVTKIDKYGKYEDKSKQQGIISAVKIVKNKLAPPFKEIHLPLDFDSGLNPLRELSNYLLDNTAVVNISGAYLSVVGFGEKDIKFYQRDFPKVVQENPGLMEWMEEQVKMHWTTGETF